MAQQMFRNAKRLSKSVTVILGTGYDQNPTTAAAAHATSFEHSSAAATAAATKRTGLIEDTHDVKQTTPCSLASSIEIVAKPRCNSHPNLPALGEVGAQPAVGPVDYDAGSAIFVPSPNGPTAAELVDAYFRVWVPPTADEVQAVSKELFGPVCSNSASPKAAARITLSANQAHNSAAIQLSHKMVEDPIIAKRAAELVSQMPKSWLNQLAEDKSLDTPPLSRTTSGTAAAGGLIRGPDEVSLSDADTDFSGSDTEPGNTPQAVIAGTASPAKEPGAASQSLLVRSSQLPLPLEDEQPGLTPVAASAAAAPTKPKPVVADAKSAPPAAIQPSVPIQRVAPVAAEQKSVPVARVVDGAAPVPQRNWYGRVYSMLADYAVSLFRSSTPRVVASNTAPRASVPAVAAAQLAAEPAPPAAAVAAAAAPEVNKSRTIEVITNLALGAAAVTLFVIAVRRVSPALFTRLLRM